MMVDREVALSHIKPLITALEQPIRAMQVV
jgi:hypothetical protein